jgi:hypothetical protein
MGICRPMKSDDRTSLTPALIPAGLANDHQATRFLRPRGLMSLRDIAEPRGVRVRGRVVTPLLNSEAECPPA